MRILHVTPYYWPAVRYGGPVFSVSGLCRALARRGHDVHVYTTAVDGQRNSDVDLDSPVSVDDVMVTYFSSPFLRRLFWAPNMKKALLRHVAQFDLVHLHTVFVWPVYAAALAARDAGVPYILTPRGMLEKSLIQRKGWMQKTLWLEFCGKAILKGAEAVQVTTRREEEEIRALRLSIPKTVLVPNGIDIPELSVRGLESISEKIEGPYVLFLSRINWKKGLDRLIKAWGEGIDIALIIAGNDEENYTAELENIAIRKGVSDKIHFIGHVSGERKWQLYRNAEMLVLPSYSENFGNVVLEAMAVGCAVVVTPEVGLSAAVAQYQAGIVVDGEPEKLAATIQCLLQDKKTLMEMGQRGRAAAQEYFSWPAIAKQMEEVYQGIKGKDEE